MERQQHLKGQGRWENGAAADSPVRGGRWENGAAADSPVREARLKALILKEQATWEKIASKLPMPQQTERKIGKMVQPPSIQKRRPFLNSKGSRTV
jgi:hypothetical protein